MDVLANMSGTEIARIVADYQRLKQRNTDVCRQYQADHSEEQKEYRRKYYINYKQTASASAKRKAAQTGAENALDDSKGLSIQLSGKRVGRTIPPQLCKKSTGVGPLDKIEIVNVN